MELIVLTPEQIQRYFNCLADDLSHRIETILKDSKNNVISKEWLTSRETCDFLKISQTTLHDWSNKGLLKKYKAGNRIRFRHDQVLETLQRIESKSRMK